MNASKTLRTMLLSLPRTYTSKTLEGCISQNYSGCLLCAESQKQYWQVKSKYRDTIIFFKVGKFYELYEVSKRFTCVRSLSIRHFKGHASCL